VSDLLAIARADVLERLRRSSFLVMTGCVLWLGYGAYTGNVRVRLEDWAGTWNSAWAGGMMAMIAATYLSMIGFWFVRNAVARDERTGVGPILATTPMTRTTYVLGKALSHFAVLAVMACVLFASAVVIQLARGGMGPVEPRHYVGPLLFVVFPALALTSACAIFFETTPGLRGAFGSVAWMFLFAGAIAGSIQSRGSATDVLGLRTLQSSMAEAIHAQHPDAPPIDGASITLGPAKARTHTFTWPGIQWSPAFLLSRGLWLLVALLIALAAAIPFHRFDPARGKLRTARDARARRRLSLPALHVPALPGLVGAELRLCLAGANPWWVLVALGLWIAAVGHSIAGRALEPLDRALAVGHSALVAARRARGAGRGRGLRADRSGRHVAPAACRPGAPARSSPHCSACRSPHGSRSAGDAARARGVDGRRAVHSRVRARLRGVVELQPVVRGVVCCNVVPRSAQPPSRARLHGGERKCNAAGDSGSCSPRVEFSSPCSLRIRRLAFTD
jgi:hypothetical protein